MRASPRKDRRNISDFEDDGLTAKGCKNARHAEEIHAEVAKTRDVIASFLKKQLAAIHPDDWQGECIDAAYNSCEGGEFRSSMPTHYDLENYDTRYLAVVMEYNLPLFVFEYGATIAPSEIRTFVTTRNICEHRGPRLNYRRWPSDLETIRFLRSKMQTDVEMASESYTGQSLPQMEADTIAYQTKHDALQHQIKAVTNTVLGLDKRLEDNAQADKEQSAELHRQQETDRQQFAELHPQQKADMEHDRLIVRC